MIHHDPCEGLNLRACESCARHVSRFTAAALERHTTRRKPYAVRGQCYDHELMPEVAQDATHDRL